MAYYRNNSSGCLESLLVIPFLILVILFIENPIAVIGFLIGLYFLYKVIIILFDSIKPYFNRVNDKIENYYFENEVCTHGVSGGWNINSCPQCVILKKEIKIRKEENDEKLRLKSIEAERANEVKFLMREAENDLIKLINKKNASKLEFLISSDPFVFEKIIGQMYEELGYKVKQTPKSNDKGKDLIMTKGGKKFIVECKRYNHSNLVGRPEVQKFYAACVEENVEKGFFVTTSDFTSSAKAYPNDIGNKILLINGISLIKLMENAYPSNVENDNYELVCGQCGDILQFELNGELEKKCKSNHIVKSNLEEIKNGIFQTASFVYLDPKCPICSSNMRKIKSKYDKNSHFWGCSRYPKCNGLLSKNDNEPNDLMDLN